MEYRKWFVKIGLYDAFEIIMYHEDDMFHWNNINYDIIHNMNYAKYIGERNCV